MDDVQLLTPKFGLTPDEQSRSDAFERSAGNMRELDLEIARTTDPAIRTKLETERARLQGNQPLDAFPSGSVQLASNDGTKNTTTVRMKDNSFVSSATMSQKLDEFLKKNADLNALMQAQLATMGTTSTEAQTAVINAGNANAKSIKTQGEIDATKAEGRTDISQFFHATTAPDSVFADQEAKRQGATRTMDSLRPRIMEESAINVWDDPLRWLVNQFTLPALTSSYNAANMQYNSSTKKIAESQALARAQEGLDLTITGQMLREKATADAQQKQFESVRDAAILNRASSHQVAQILMQQSALAGHELEAWQRMVQLYTMTQTDAMADKDEKAMAPALASINTKRKAAGLPEMSWAEFKMRGAAEKTYLLNNAAIPYAFGGNPGDAYLYLTNTGGLNTIGNINPNVSQTLGRQLQSTDFRNHMAQMAGKDPKFASLSSDEQYAKALEDWNNQERTTFVAKNQYNKLDPNSPYALKIGNVVQYKELEGNQFTKIVDEQLKRQNYQGAVKSEVIEQAALAKVIADPSQRQQVAKDLADFWRTAQEQQWAKSGASQLGYQRPTSYGTTTMTTGGKPVNQWNPVEIEHWLMTAVSRNTGAQRLLEIQSAGPAMNMNGLPPN
jgi:hypothetical protein